MDGAKKFAPFFCLQGVRCFMFTRYNPRESDNLNHWSRRVMPRRIIQTTRKIQYNEDGEPIETVVQREEQAPIDPVTGTVQETVYEPVPTQQRVTYTYPTTTQPVQESQVYEPETGVQRI